MVFEFLKWRASFEEHERGVRKGELTYRRPRPFFDVRSKSDWLKFVVYLFGGSITAGICGIVAYFVVSGIVGGLVFDIMTWVWLFIGGWIAFWILHLVHSIRFYKIAKLTDVEFVSLDKVEAIGKRLMTMPGDLTTADYNIFYSRYIWADVECEPFRDVTDWVERIAAAQTGQAVSVGGGDFAESIGEYIGAAIGEKYSESKLKEIVDRAGGIPSPQEITKIIQTEIVPRYRELLGERLTVLYLVFLMSQPPVLPFDKSTTRSDMRAVASVSDTKEVIDYLSKFAPKE